MIQTLKLITAAFSKPSFTLDQTVSLIGVLVGEHDAFSSLVIQPFESAFQEAILVRRYGTQEIAHVTLRLAPNEHLTVHILQEAFGDYTKLTRTDWNQPVSILFPAHSLIAELASDDEAMPNARIGSVTIRKEA